MEFRGDQEPRDIHGALEERPNPDWPRLRRPAQQHIHAPQPQPQLQPADVRPPALSLITRILRLIEGTYYTSLALCGRTATHTALISYPLQIYLCLHLPDPHVCWGLPPELKGAIAELVGLVNCVQDIWWDLRFWRTWWQLVCAIGEWFGWRWIRAIDRWVKGWMEWVGVAWVLGWLPGGRG